MITGRRRKSRPKKSVREHARESARVRMSGAHLYERRRRDTRLGDLGMTFQVQRIGRPAVGPLDGSTAEREEKSACRFVRGQSRSNSLVLRAGLRYTEFTEGVARSSAAGESVELTLMKFVHVGPALGITMGRYNFQKNALDFGQSARF
jgi:hypothetical protein